MNIWKVRKWLSGESPPCVATALPTWLGTGLVQMHHLTIYFHFEFPFSSFLYLLSKFVMSTSLHCCLVPTVRRNYPLRIHVTIELYTLLLPGSWYLLSHSQNSCQKVSSYIKWGDIHIWEFCSFSKGFWSYFQIVLAGTNDLLALPVKMCA